MTRQDCRKGKRTAAPMQDRAMSAIKPRPEKETTGRQGVSMWALAYAQPRGQGERRQSSIMRASTQNNDTVRYDVMRVQHHDERESNKAAPCEHVLQAIQAGEGQYCEDGQSTESVQDKTSRCRTRWGGWTTRRLFPCTPRQGVAAAQASRRGCFLCRTN